MRLRIGHLSTLYHTALLISGLNLLGKTKISATWRLFGGGPAIVEALKKDELDIGYVGLPPAMIGISEEVDIRCVAGGHIEGTVLSGLKQKSGMGGKILKTLEGGKIGSPPKGSIHDIILRHLLEKGGIDAQVANYPWADFIPLAIEAGEIKAAIGTPALAALLKKDLGLDILLPPDKLWPFNPSYGIISRENFLDSRGLKQFIQIHEEACSLLIKRPKEAADNAAKILGVIDSSFALEVISLSPHYCASLPEEYIESTMNFIAPMKRLGYIKKDLKKRDIFYTAIIDEIHKEENHYKNPIRNY